MRAGLHEKDLHADPLAQFGNWFDEALRSGIALPNAMTLATATRKGRPSARAVLLKGFDALGFVFYTHYGSRKGRELEENPQAMPSRPLGSRLSATVSPQSEPVASREALEMRMEEASKRFRDSPPRPAHWGGYRLAPERFEFWQGRKDRLHDRLCYRRAGGAWKIERLAP